MRTFVLGALVLAFLAWSAPPVGAQAAPGQLAFAGPFGIWTIRDDGRGEQLLATGSPADMPAWSPDGQRLVYVITAGPETGAWIYDLRDGSRRQLAREPWRWPAWSPDGRRIRVHAPAVERLGPWDLGPPAWGSRDADHRRLQRGAPVVAGWLAPALQPE
ncbi:MAG: hypothetical protein KatS3mg061_0675 [Dehalococcoidia bacterium]|nr:MAG: hypothetical protein KatS3mg061_0675 [Dehalococcoidia bacterium]